MTFGQSGKVRLQLLADQGAVASVERARDPHYDIKSAGMVLLVPKHLAHDPPHVVSCYCQARHLARHHHRQPGLSLLVWLGQDR